MFLPVLNVQVNMSGSKVHDIDMSSSSRNQLKLLKKEEITDNNSQNF